MKIFSSVFTKNEHPASRRDSELDRPMTTAEKRRMFKKWKVQKGGTAGIPSTWMWKTLDELTLAEAIVYQEALSSGRTWGEIQADGLVGDEGRLRDFEYRALYNTRERRRIDWVEVDPDYVDVEWVEWHEDTGPKFKG